MSPGKNCLEVTGTLVELDRLRYTPAGVPIVQFRIRHESSQEEAGLLRKVSCEVGCMAIDREAKVLATAALGETLWLKGFVDQKSRSSSQLVFHVTHLEFKKSN